MRIAAAALAGVVLAFLISFGVVRVVTTSSTGPGLQAAVQLRHPVTGGPAGLAC